MKTVTVNISFRKDLLERIDKAAKDESRSRSELIREAARDYIEKRYPRKIKYTYLDINPEKREGAEGYVSEEASLYGDYRGKKYTYRDYLEWPDDERWEIIEGVPYNMSPAPSPRHQNISMALSAEFYNYLKGKPCKVFPAPFDVRLPEVRETADDSSNVVQPDITIICDKSKIDKRGCTSAPDLVVEILSHYTAKKDVIRKFRIYERLGVGEYWVIRPDEETVTVFKLGQDKKYGRPDIYCRRDKVKAGIFDGLAIDLEDVFRE